jgi:acyl-CoA thioesterase FadM
MYVWARLARTLATAGKRGPYRMGGESRLSFRCLPSDIDTNLHLNNARYMMLADVGRFDIFSRSGLIGLARSRRWAPMLGGLQTVFVREIRLWKRFELVSTLETWRDTQVIGQHRFVLDGDVTAAVVLTTGGIYDGANRRFVPIDEALEALGPPVTPREPTQAEAIFMASHAQLRAIAKTTR